MTAPLGTGSKSSFSRACHSIPMPWAQRKVFAIGCKGEARSCSSTVGGDLISLACPSFLNFLKNKCYHLRGKKTQEPGYHGACYFKACDQHGEETSLAGEKLAFEQTGEIFLVEGQSPVASLFLSPRGCVVMMWVKDRYTCFLWELCSGVGMWGAHNRRWSFSRNVCSLIMM